MSGGVREVLVVAAIVAASVARPTLARAADEQVCMDAEVRGQRLQKAAHLLEAREAFVTCARASCPQVVVDYCARWLADANRAIPSIVVSVRDGEGRDRLDTSVRIDGRASPEATSGQAVELDPGEHTIEIARASEVLVSQTIVLHEAEKLRHVIVTTSSPSTPSPSGIPPLTVGLGIAGVAAGGLFVYEWLHGVSDRSSFGCDTSFGCSSDQASSVHNQFLVADVALVVSLAALAGAAIVWIAKGSSSPPLSALLEAGRWRF